MMNNSGVAVKKLITNYQLPITHLWGIGRPEHEFSEQEAEAFVLSPFRKEERSKAKRLVKNAVKAIKIAQDHGLARAMNQFN
jgi:peptidyl-tRNA hydrolase